MTKTAPQYQPADYAYEVAWSRGDEAFVARVVDFPLLAADGETMELALAAAREVVQIAIDDMIERGQQPPTPRTANTYSGKILLRLPPALHRELAEEAVVADSSLNQHITNILLLRRRPDPRALPGKRSKRTAAKGARAPTKKTKRAR